ncbi:nucleotidyltransferase family protein [Microbacterium lacticum]
MEEARLSLDEANDLLSAWAWTRGRERGIRLLLIKGRTLSNDGLRAARTSADVDALVEPARFEEYCQAITEAGWQEIPQTFASRAFTLHSRSFHREGWPNSFDVHRHFPGFLAEPEAVFGELWARRRLAPFAHVPCPVPDRAANVLFLALHSLRSTDLRPRHRAELEHLLHVPLNETEKSEVAALAQATGAAAPAEEVLARMGVDLSVDPAVRESEAYRHWRLTAVRVSATPWLSLFLRAPWREKPRIAFRALWPSTQDFSRYRPGVEPGFVPRARERLRRLGRGIRSLPRALRELRDR